VWVVVGAVAWAVVWVVVGAVAWAVVWVVVRAGVCGLASEG
jgi:hypothetical protein